jgi:hypothetical protein
MTFRRRLRLLFTRAKSSRKKTVHAIRPAKSPAITATAFWKAYDAHAHPTPAERKRTFNPWSGFKQRHPIRVSHSILGVVRQFKSAGELATYEENVQRTNHFLTERSFVHFVYQPIS